MRQGAVVRRAGQSGGFAIRHRLLLLLLWAHVPILATLGPVVGMSLPGVGLSSLLLISLAMAAMLVRSPILAAVYVALGLVVSAAILVLFTEGQPGAHLYFLVIVGAVSLYRDWRPLSVSLVAVVTYYLVTALTRPGSAGVPTDPGTALWWATLHAGFAALLAVLLVSGWRTNSETPGDRGRSEERFRIGFVEAPIGMAILKPSGEFVEMNRAFTSILGYESDQLTGTNIRGVVHADDLPELGESWEEMGNSPTHSATTLMRCLTGSGETFWGRVSLALVPHSRDQPALVVLQLEDVTGPYLEQRRLERLIEGKDEFVAAVGDEMRRPLKTLIDLTSGDPEMQTIVHHAREVASIIDDLVVSARAGSSPVSLLQRDCDAGDLCRQVLSSVPGGESVDLQIAVTKLWVDPGLTRQIVFGLVSNALRYGGPTVRVRTTASGPDTLIQVIDDGPEVPKQERERIFSGDLRHGFPVTRPAAVGLSLSVGRHLARQMDGDIIYHRNDRGENVFELRLPSERLSAPYAPDPGEIRVPA